MARFTIYSSDGASVRHIGEPNYNGTYMGVDYVEFHSIASPTPIDWAIGDYVDYNRTGLRYRLYSLPQPKKVSRSGSYGAAFEYANVQLYSATKELEIAPFRDLASEDNNIHFSTNPGVNTFENVAGIARRIQECMDDLFPGKWRIEVYQTEDSEVSALLDEVKEFSLSNGSCLDALSQIYETWENIGWIHTYDETNGVDVITIARANVRDEENTSDVFSYGLGNELTSIKKASANDGEFATRLYVYGSQRNLAPRYYNNQEIKDAESVQISHLMLPQSEWGLTDGLPDARKAYIQCDDSIVEKFGLIPRTVYFDGSEHEEIYPSIEGLTEAEVRQAMIDAGHDDDIYLPGDNEYRVDEIFASNSPDDYGNIANADGTVRTDTLETTFLLEIYDIGFNISEYAALANEQGAVVSMKTGTCAGREFQVKGVEWNGGTWILTLERQLDDSLNMLFPNNDYLILPGDYFVLLDIAMPAYYVTINEQRLLEAGEKVLADYSRVSPLYEPSINSKSIIEGGKVLRAGMYMQVYDEDIIDTEDNTDYILIDTLSINEKSELPQYKVTLREQKRSARTFSALEGMIDDAKDVSQKELDRARQYTDRRFRSAQESLSMLQDAFTNFSEGISPVTVQTMALLIGDESLQFKFTASRDSLDDIPCPLVWDNTTKQMRMTAASLIHMTLGIEDVTIKGNRVASEYHSWDIPAKDSEVLEDSKARYVYIRASQSDAADAEFILSEGAIGMTDEEGYYHFLVGLLNSEFDSSRDFVPLYGFTEILPGQITTDVIRSADGSCYFDLANNEIGGIIKFSAGSSGAENLDINIGAQNLLRNSGFTGDYLSEPLADEDVLDAATELYSSPLDHWDTTGTVSVVSLEGTATSGNGVTISKTSTISQTLANPTIVGETYIVSFKGMRGTGVGLPIAVSLGGATQTLILATEWTEYSFKLVATEASDVFTIKNNTSLAVTICDIQLERGSISTSWARSPFDNTSDRTYYQSLKYLQSALEGATEIGGGLVLTEQVRVGDYDKDTESWVAETGGMSGIYETGEDVAFWAGGSFDQAIATVAKYTDDPTYQPTDEELAAMASFVVTHGGRAILNDMVLRGYVYALGGKIGNINLGERGLEINDEIIDGEVKLDDYGLRGEGSGFAFQVGNCGNETAAFSHGDGSYLTCTNTPSALRLDGYNGAFALHLNRGLVAGLRPNIRKITTTETYPLTTRDHTILIVNTASITITLANNPENGQVYKFIHTTRYSVTFTPSSSSQTIINPLTGAEVESLSETFVMTLTYFDSVWYAEIDS